jgi:hypothetical protein
MEFVIVLVVLAVVVFVISGPLRAAAAPGGPVVVENESATAAVDELEAEREAKYREIREAELDHRIGKLSDADHEAIDRALRTEAIEILRKLDQARRD